MIDWILKLIGHRWAWLLRWQQRRAAARGNAEPVMLPGLNTDQLRDVLNGKHPCPCGEWGLHNCPIPIVRNISPFEHAPRERKHIHYPAGDGPTVIEYAAGAKPPPAYTCHYCGSLTLGPLPFVCLGCGATAREAAPGSALVQWELSSQPGAYDIAAEGKRLSLELDTFATQLRARGKR